MGQGGTGQVQGEPDVPTGTCNAGLPLLVLPVQWLHRHAAFTKAWAHISVCWPGTVACDVTTTPNTYGFNVDLFHFALWPTLAVVVQDGQAVPLPRPQLRCSTGR